MGKVEIARAHPVEAARAGVSVVFWVALFFGIAAPSVASAGHALAWKHGESYRRAAEILRVLGKDSSGPSLPG
jgi:hypothetical protein